MTFKTFGQVSEGDNIYLINPYNSQIQECLVVAIKSTRLIGQRIITYIIPHHQSDLLPMEERPKASITVKTEFDMVLTVTATPIPFAPSKERLEEWVKKTK